MPTPFYHLSLAHELLEEPGLKVNVRDFLNQRCGAFLFGKTAPDAQVVSGQAREATHFYTLPPQDDTPAWETMLAAHPSLAQAGRLPPEQAAFLAGYLCHLQADERWLYEIFIPAFGPEADWETFRQRLYRHNVLRAYLDRQVLESLPADTGQHLQAAEPDSWLPFVADAHLREWRRLLAEQLRPGAEVQTVDVFAGRLGLSAQEFHRLLDSEKRMEKEVFAHLPRRWLEDYRQRLVAQNLHLLNEYLSVV